MHSEFFTFLLIKWGNILVGLKMGPRVCRSCFLSTPCNSSYYFRQVGPLSGSPLSCLCREAKLHVLRVVSLWVCAGLEAVFVFHLQEIDTSLCIPSVEVKILNGQGWCYAV